MENDLLDKLTNQSLSDASPRGMVLNFRSSDFPRQIKFQLGRRVYAMCGSCKKMVRVNKRILGSLHICT
jgi:hypothetical protein